MEWQLTVTRKAEYERAMRTAQDIEANIGSSQYRISKLIDVRKDMDIQIKKWWDEVIKEMSLDNTKDYMITMDGVIKDVSKNETSAIPTPPAPVAQTLDTKAVSDLK
jgi:hypothetical protein